MIKYPYQEIGGVDMDIFELKEMKKAAGLTNQEIADLSGIPFSTIHKIFSGATKNPRYSTLLAIEEVILTRTKIPFSYRENSYQPMMVEEAAAPYLCKARKYQMEDMENLEEGVRAELINGSIYMLGAPNRKHQYILSNMMFQIMTHIDKNKGKCHVYPAPFDVKLYGDDSTIVQPDITVICDTDKLTDRGCSGAPEWVIEIASTSNFKHDFVTKLMLYQIAGVKEYWIVDPQEEMVYVHNFENTKKSRSYTFEESVICNTLQGLEIHISV